jgi:effector-binding domain-containing protein
MRALPILLLLFAAAELSCRSSSAVRPSTESTWRYVPDLEVSRPPFTRMHVNYKERLDEAYVFVDVLGSYTETGRELGPLHDRMRSAGVRAAGPPFGLFYDDPGETPVNELRSRACFPVEPEASLPAEFERDVLPPTTVVYAVVSGPYPDAPRAYRGLFEYANRLGWTESGPLREIYLVAPASVASFDELLCEIQLPVTSAP